MKTRNQHKAKPHKVSKVKSKPVKPKVVRVAKTKVSKSEIKKSKPAVAKRVKSSVKKEIKQPSERKPAKEKAKATISPGQIQRVLNTGHPDDLYITLKLLDEAQAVKLLTYFRKNHTALHKKKDLAKAIMAAKTKAELLNNVKNYLIGALKKEYEELKMHTSTLRKKGADVLIEDLKIMKIPAKIRFFEATEDKHDFYVAKDLIDKIKSEVALKV